MRAPFTIKAAIRTALAAAILASASACHRADVPQPVAQPSERTVLIYMAANNSLGSNGADTADMNEMAAAARAGMIPAGANVLVYRAGYYADKTQTLLRLNPADGSWTELQSFDGSTLTSVHPERMTEVIAAARTLAPARVTSLVLWSHSMGWTNGPDITPHTEPTPALRSFGLDHGREMSISDLAKALVPFHFDYIYFDCCYMGSAEVTYELRHSVDLIVASATEVPFEGMPYTATLPLLAAGQPAQAAAITAMHYQGRTGSYCPASHAVVRTAALPSLARATAAIYAAAERPGADFIPQSFSVTAGCRFFDLEEYVEAVAPPSQPQLLEQWHLALDSAVVQADCSSMMWGYAIRRHCGLSTNILTSAADSLTKGYCRLQWWADTGLPAYLKPHN